jgi:acetyl-CoA carboxylase biotin carboxyl carrier protein
MGSVFGAVEMPPKNPSRGKARSERTWDLGDIQQLIDLLIDREITEFEMEKGGVKIRINRGNPHGGSAPVEQASLSASSSLSLNGPSSPAAASPAPPAHAAAESLPAESTEGLYMMKSPIVGTFYAAPAPSAPPFVKMGDVVEAGQVLCIIEAMKLMNDIEAEVAGEIVRIYVENGQPVEYGQSLFAIKPIHKR